MTTNKRHFIWGCALVCAVLALSACEAEDDGGTTTSDTSASTAPDGADSSGATEEDTHTGTHEDVTHEDGTAHEDGTHEDGTHTEHAHWGYEGEIGPEYWGDLSPEYALCKTGVEQSPIDINTEIAPLPVDGMIPDYKSASAVVLNNGHTVQVNVPAGSGFTANGQFWTLQQFHFHAESEHTLNGVHAPLEVHFVHSNDEADLAVIGVMFEVGDIPNPVMDALKTHWPSEESSAADTGVVINPRDLMPADLTGWGYKGSLTIPSCSEGVEWLVVATPLVATLEEIQTLADIIGPNNRPTQPLNDRSLGQ